MEEYIFTLKIRNYFSLNSFSFLTRKVQIQTEVNIVIKGQGHKLCYFSPIFIFSVNFLLLKIFMEQQAFTFLETLKNMDFSKTYLDRQVKRKTQY